jgi:hypothetical protein
MEKGVKEKRRPLIKGYESLILLSGEEYSPENGIYSSRE